MSVSLSKAIACGDVLARRGGRLTSSKGSPAITDSKGRMRWKC